METQSTGNEERLAALRAASGAGARSLISLSFHTAAVADPDAGTVAIFVDDAVVGDDVWTEIARLSPSAPANGFGASVRAWGNTVLVGAPGAGASGAGAVYVFYRDWSGFQEEAVLEPEGGASGEAFGAAVALSGDTAVVGAPGAGAAYVFARKRRVWRLEERLEPKADESGSGFGAAVSVQGDSALVGASAGEAFRFERHAGHWLEGGVAEKGGGSVFQKDGDESLRIGDCASATTLNALVTCIRAQMPRSGSEGFVPPTSPQRSALRTAVRRMMQGECGFALDESISSPMRIRTFVDNLAHPYCVLMEVEDEDEDGYVDRGWGTFIVNSNAARQIVHTAPHPLFDTGTELEAVDIFEATESRAFLLCGAHRNANSASSSCQPSYKQADCAHETQNMFFRAIQEIEVYYAGAPHAIVQWHGMAATSCPGVNVYLAEGLLTPPAPSSLLPELHDNTIAANPLWNVDMAGDGTCNLNATDNVGGRLINGISVSDVCTTEPTTASGRFIHVEQQPNYRKASDWVAPVENTFPPAAAVPPAPTGVTAQAGYRAVRVSWAPMPGIADGFDISRSLSSAGPFTVIAHVTTGTSYTNTGLPAGTRRYYRVQATNAAGASAPSSVVSAVPSSTLAPPTGLTATAGVKSVQLSWTESIGATRYRVQRSTVSGGPYSTITSYVTGTTYTNTGLTSGKTYYYVVRAINGSVVSTRSSQVAATPY